MSMVQLTVVQWLLAFLIYSGLTVALPAIVIYPRVAHCRAVTRFFFYFSIGNFYLMNLVYLLELLHISNRLTLLLGTALPAAIVAVRLRQIPVRERIRDSRKRLQRLIKGSFGAKNWLRQGAKRLGFHLGRWVKRAAYGVHTHFSDCLLIAFVFAVVVGFYGRNLVDTFGYCASDIPVHNYWINHLGQNDIFVGGVYPFGFHNTIYYIHEVFGLDTYVLLRVFWLVQTLWIHLILMMFLKGVCRSRFLPYFGPIVFAVGNFHYESYKRYYASLPQEFGMLFILPAVYFAFEFFRIKKEELKGWREKPVSGYYLIGFALNFAMTFSAHFYGTIILGIFCVGIACGYAVRFLRPKYFVKVVKTCLIGLFIAVLPLVAAYLMGTRLEGSLRWAMSVMMPEETAEEEERGSSYEFDENGIPIGAPIVRMEDGVLAYADVLYDGATIYYPIDTREMTAEEEEELLKGGYTGEIRLAGDELISDGEGEGTRINSTDGDAEHGDARPDITAEQRRQELRQKALRTLEQIDQMIATYQFGVESKSARYLIYLAIVICFVMAALFLVAREFDYAFSLLSVNMHIIFMIVLLCMSSFGLPQLMEPSRSCIYLNYSIPVLWVLALDSILYFLFGLWKWRTAHRIMNLASFVALALCCSFMVETDSLKRPHEVDVFQTNGAITCLTNIISENKDGTWTIVSANDETRMGEDHGYHYELISFLQEMEYTGGISSVTIPTHMVYFFIEKVPLDYSIEYEDSGQSISREGAANPLPDGGGISAYMGENRWIVMSRMYEWADTYQRMYPNEMKVYYEDDTFICYALEQNDYHLYNLSVDYGYNMRRSSASAAAIE